MVKRPLEEENGQNLESICRAVKRLHTSSGNLPQQASNSSGLNAMPDQLAGLHPGAPQQQQHPTASGGVPVSPAGQLPVGVAGPSWNGAGPGAAASTMHAQQNGFHHGYQDGARPGADAAAAQYPLQHQQDALQEQLRRQKLVHEQQYLARQQQAQQPQHLPQGMQPDMQQHIHQQQGASPDYAGPSTPRQAEGEHTPTALLARESVAYEAPNTLLKELHFERLRRLTLADDDGPGSASRWQFNMSQ